jgi:hypothetical protein
MLIAALLFLGMSCQTRYVEVPVLGTAEAPFTVNSSDGFYRQTGAVDATDLIERIKKDNNFEEILGIHLQGVSYKITNLSAGNNTVLNGSVDVTSDPKQAFQGLIKVQNLKLADVAEQVQLQALLQPGVLEIDKAISPFVGGTNRIYFQVTGQGTPAPPPNLRFQFLIKVSLIVVGKVKVSVPVM